jgi:hypothetical protein
MAEAGDRETTAECRLLGLQCHNRTVVTLGEGQLSTVPFSNLLGAFHHFSPFIGYARNKCSAPPERAC